MKSKCVSLKMTKIDDEITDFNEIIEYIKEVIVESNTNDIHHMLLRFKNLDDALFLSIYNQLIVGNYDATPLYENYINEDGTVDKYSYIDADWEKAYEKMNGGR